MDSKLGWWAWSLNCAAAPRLESWVRSGELRRRTGEETFNQNWGTFTPSHHCIRIVWLIAVLKQICLWSEKGHQGPRVTPWCHPATINAAERWPKPLRRCFVRSGPAIRETTNKTWNGPQPRNHHKCLTFIHSLYCVSNFWVGRFWMPHFLGKCWILEKSKQVGKQPWAKTDASLLRLSSRTCPPYQ